MRMPSSVLFFTSLLITCTLDAPFRIMPVPFWLITQLFTMVFAEELNTSKPPPMVVSVGSLNPLAVIVSLVLMRAAASLLT